MLCIMNMEMHARKLGRVSGSSATFAAAIPKADVTAHPE